MIVNLLNWHFRRLMIVESIELHGTHGFLEALV